MIQHNKIQRLKEISQRLLAINLELAKESGKTYFERNRTFNHLAHLDNLNLEKQRLLIEMSKIREQLNTSQRVRDSYLKINR